MTAQTEKPVVATRDGIFGDFKECEEIFLRTIKERKVISLENFEIVTQRMNALEQKFLREYPWAEGEDYFILPNKTAYRILFAVGHTAKLFEMSNGEWHRSHDFKDINTQGTLISSDVFNLYKITACHDMVGILKEREYVGFDISALCVFIDFRILQRITYKGIIGQVQTLFKEELDSMEDSEIHNLIPKKFLVTNIS